VIVIVNGQIVGENPWLFSCWLRI